MKAQPNPNSWISSLPLILLGIRTALKQDLNSTAAEMVYGTTLRLPGEFFAPSPISSLPDPSEFLNTLKVHFQHSKPTSPRANSRHSNIPHHLEKATHVFISHDAIRKPLQPPYDGPYPIIQRTDKYYTVKLNNRTENISIDRLKPAHLDIPDEVHSRPQPNSFTPQPPSPPSTPTTTNSRTTRSGWLC